MTTLTPTAPESTTEAPEPTEAPELAEAPSPASTPAAAQGTRHLLRRVLQDREALIGEVVANKPLRVAGVAAIGLGLSALAGMAIGAATGPAQALAAAAKVPVIYLLSLVVCFPALFIFGLLQGSKLRLETALRLFGVGIGMRGAVLAGLAPLLLFFSTVGTPYAGLLLGALLAFGVAELGFLHVIDKGLSTLRAVHEDGLQPWLVRAWTLVHLGVLAQLGWSMRPLIRHPSITEFHWFGGPGQSQNMFFYFLEQLRQLAS